MKLYTKYTSTAATTEFVWKIPNRKKISYEHFSLCEAEIFLDEIIKQRHPWTPIVKATQLHKMSGVVSDVVSNTENRALKKQMMDSNPRCSSGHI